VVRQAYLVLKVYGPSIPNVANDQMESFRYDKPSHVACDERYLSVLPQEDHGPENPPQTCDQRNLPQQRWGVHRHNLHEPGSAKMEAERNQSEVVHPIDKAC